MPKRKYGRTPPRKPRKRSRGRAKYKRRYKGYAARRSAALKYLKGSKKFTAAVRRTARRKRAVKRKKKINKVISRVLTSMNDDKVTMYRQYIKPGLTLKGTGLTTSILDKDGTLDDGDYIATDNDVIRKVIKREDRDFFQINAFHGFCGPAYQGNGVNNLDSTDGAKEDDVVMHDTGISDSEAINNPARSAFNKSGIDVRAYKEVEIPMLPCIPFEDDSRLPTSSAKYYQAFSRFGRRGDKIKITNNYMRFDFFPVRNGEVKYANGSPINILGDNSNIDFTYAAGGLMEHLKYTSAIQLNENPTDVYAAANKTKDYKIISPRFCKVRFILFERECYHKDPVKLNDFLKEYNDSVSPPEAFNDLDMGTEEYKKMQIFNRGKRTQRDLTDPTAGQDKDIVDQLMLKMKGKCVIDKTRNLPMNTKTTVIFNPLKGKVLTYDPNQVITTDDDAYTTPLINNTATNSNEYITRNLPTHVNAVRALDDGTQETTAKLSEYVPKNKQYGMFMLIYTSRCAVEYDIFQKFEYDK